MSYLPTSKNCHLAAGIIRDTKMLTGVTLKKWIKMPLAGTGLPALSRRERKFIWDEYQADYKLDLIRKKNGMIALSNLAV